ncbi:MAG: crosslink repair DNA glycosylase YcaQ family protein, partial [Kiloniellales bacterium]|nr:crosslink repair DNA glycosylase YcaQ family protein [Kiloniellales bacterium]
PLISNADARRAFLAGQGLARPVGGRLTREGLYGQIERLGFVQVDSINTVERAHHLILFARNHNYRHGQLTHLLERKAALFENWTHDASIIPTRFYPYWMCRFAKERETLRERWRKWRPGDYEAVLEQVLDHVRAAGPVMARHLGDDKKKNAQGWWDWHPSKTALEYLWRTGELAVARREGFQKVYDLTERVIPAEHRQGAPGRAALIDWACRSALERLVFATSGELAAFWDAVTPAEAAHWCRGRLGDELVEVTVEPANGKKPRTAYARPDYQERLAETPAPPGAIRVLSPFDPLIRDRNRTERLFDFRYRIEVFVPEARREYGYYVFPLLEGDRLIGRIDMKRTKDGALSVSALWLEPRLKFTRAREAKLTSELDRLAQFVGAEAVRFENGFLRGAR